MKIKRMIAALVLIAFLICMGGCLSPVSLDAYGYVISVGIDRGKEKRFYYTFALQRELAEQNTESEGGAIALACEGDTVFEAVNELEGSIPYSLNFSRVNFIIAGREVAEAGELEDFVSTSFDALKIRTSAVVIVAEKSVSEFVGGMYANNDANITKLQSALMLDRKKTGMVTVMSVSRLIEACSDGRFDYCAALGDYDEDVITDMNQKKSEAEGENPLKDVETGDRVGGLKSFVSGAALFSGWRMTGTLTREETMFLNMVTGEFKNGTLTLEFGDGAVTVLLTLKKRRIRVEGISKTGIKAGAEVFLEASVHRKPEDASPEEMNEWITNTLPKLITERISEVFGKCRTAGSDAMRFGTEAVKLFSTAEDWESFGWKEQYLRLDPVFSVNVSNVDKYLSEDMQ